MKTAETSFFCWCEISKTQLLTAAALIWRLRYTHLQEKNSTELCIIL